MEIVAYFSNLEIVARSIVITMAILAFGMGILANVLKMEQLVAIAAIFGFGNFVLCIVIFKTGEWVFMIYAVLSIVFFMGLGVIFFNSFCQVDKPK